MQFFIRFKVVFLLTKLITITTGLFVGHLAHAANNSGITRTMTKVSSGQPPNITVTSSSSPSVLSPISIDIPVPNNNNNNNNKNSTLSPGTDIIGPRVRRSQILFCPPGHFECIVNPSLCIPQSKICNGKVDCPEDGSDELHCDNIHERDFWDSYFQKRPDSDFEKNSSCKYEFKTELAAAQLNMSKADDERNSNSNKEKTKKVQTGGATATAAAGENEFNQAGSKNEETGASGDLIGCRCVSEKIFCPNLHHAIAPNILQLLPKNVEFIDLSGSVIRVQDFVHMDFPQLHTLILSSCSIGELPPGVFSSQPKLETLHLTNNRLITIPNDAFKSNRNLLKLFLGYNGLSSISPSAFQGLESLQHLDLRHNELTGTEPDVFNNLKSLRILQLSGNKIHSIAEAHYNGLKSLEILNLGNNLIDSVESYSFYNLPALKQLYLSSNKIRELHNNTFCNLESLLNLNLNGNEISRIQVATFTCLENLESLNLEGNRFGELDQPKLIFGNLTKLSHIYFDQFWMCWWASHVRDCEPKGDGISSVENLLDNILLRTCVWIMGLLGVVGNAFVITSRFLFREKNRAHSFYIKNLALADLLMGLFLLSIAIHDVKYRGEFLAHQHSWRHSMTCQLSGMLSTLSSEGSVLILTLITLDRYLSIVKPFAERTSSLRPAIAIITFLWLISFALSYLPLAGLADGYFGKEFYTSNGLCLPLQIHNPYDPGWEYSFTLFVVLNSIAFSFICFAYWTMLRIIQTSSTTLRTNQQNQDGILAMRFGLVVATDFICWAPVIIGRILAMSGVKIPSTFYAWLAVFVLPVNSSLNPILYTLTTKLFKQQMSKLTLGFRKRLRRGLTDDSSASLSFFYRATHRTTTTSMGNSMSVVNPGNTRRGRDGSKGFASESERKGFNSTFSQASMKTDGREKEHVSLLESNGKNKCEIPLTTISSHVPELRPLDLEKSESLQNEEV